MPHFPAPIASRLPAVGTTIFTIMSRLAQECGAINLSQGFPDFSAEDVLFERVAHWMRAGHNQYAPMAGVPALRAAIVAKVEALYGAAYDPEHEVTVTAGATQALFTAVAALVHPGDEVIVFEPVYDSYVPAIELQGGIVRRARLSAPDYRPDWQAVRALVTPRTRMIMINTPHNPTGTVWQAGDQERLARLVRGTDILILSDEVYEHVVFDGALHQSVIRYPELVERSVAVFSFGKTFHVTGWRVGYCVAPRPLMEEIRKVHQFAMFAADTPMQYGFAHLLQQPAHYQGLAAFYQRKRDLLATALADSRLTLLPSAGSFFMLASYERVSDEPDSLFVQRLIRDHGVATIPVSAFYHDGTDQRVIRLSFSKDDDTLLAGAERLCAV